MLGPCVLTLALIASLVMVFVSCGISFDLMRRADYCVNTGQSRSYVKLDTYGQPQVRFVHLLNVSLTAQCRATTFAPVWTVRGSSTKYVPCVDKMLST